MPPIKNSKMKKQLNVSKARACRFLSKSPSLSQQQPISTDDASVGLPEVNVESPIEREVNQIVKRSNESNIAVWKNNLVKANYALEFKKLKNADASRRLKYGRKMKKIRGEVVSLNKTIRKKKPPTKKISKKFEDLSPSGKSRRIKSSKQIIESSFGDKFMLTSSDKGEVDPIHGVELLILNNLSYVDYEKAANVPNSNCK